VPTYSIKLRNGQRVNVTADTLKAAVAQAGTQSGQAPDPAWQKQVDTAQDFAQKRSAQAQAGTVGGFLNAVANGTDLGLTNRVDAGRAALQTLAGNATRDAYHLPHQFSAGQAYQAVRDTDAADDAQFAKAHPMLNLAGNTAGSLISPVNGRRSADPVRPGGAWRGGEWSDGRDIGRDRCQGRPQGRGGLAGRRRQRRCRCGFANGRVGSLPNDAPCPAAAE
jgi:hypothetical protein